MSSVAKLFPAHTDANGNTWYRPVRDPGVGVDQWGWTSDPAQADPSYAQDVTVCSTAGATAGDRAALLEFAAQLRAKAAAAETDCADSESVPDPAGANLPAAVPGWLPGLTVPGACE